jgi:hypothetical protein
MTLSWKGMNGTKTSFGRLCLEDLRHLLLRTVNILLQSQAPWECQVQKSQRLRSMLGRNLPATGRWKDS